MDDAAINAPHFNDPGKAREFLEAKRWPNGPECPHCGITGKARRLMENKKAQTHARAGLWNCGACHKQFTVTVGTIMQDSHIPLNKWLLAFHLLCANKQGMGVHQMHRMLGLTYRSAWFMMYRIGYAMMQEPVSSQLNRNVGNRSRKKADRDSSKGLTLNPLPFDDAVADVLKVKPESEADKPCKICSHTPCQCEANAG